MKPSGSPCPLDQISVISLKRCPYLRTYLTEIIQTSNPGPLVPFLQNGKKRARY